jgi:diacylglycerol kinase family enzyme
MLLLANGLSGSQRAAVLAQDCARRLRLHACQVRLLTNDAAMVTRVLNEWHTVPGHVVCVMGGDGTVSCVMAAMDSLDYGAQGRPALLVVPQGTGNDLARALGCGAAAPSVRAVLGILKRIPFDAPDAIVQLDRWHVTGPRPPISDEGPARHVFNNYCSFGMGQ